MKLLMSGNEAIARGAYDYGARFGSGYPGTPSTEIMEVFSQFDGVYAEWSPNEKVALEVGFGAALAGESALVTMKHVGLNVAADPLMTASYTGTNGALVIVSADDPSMHSSQNEQDNRNYAKFAKIPLLEPADSDEAYRYVKMAFDISRRFDTPVILRSTTRVSHSKGIVHIENPQPYQDHRTIRPDPDKYVMVPALARIRRREVEKRLVALNNFAETFPENRIEIANSEIGIITAGMCYNHAKSKVPDYSYLKLGMVYPLPVQLIRNFAAQVKKLVVIEELDPFIENEVRALGIPVIGKAILPYTGEFDPGIVYEALTGEKIPVITLSDVTVPPRPPNLCPGCPHRGLFHTLGKLKVFVTGDIGCYTLAYMKPLAGLHACICMGASIGMAHGMRKALKGQGKGKIVGVIGDSTFLHSGITSLLDVAYNQGDAVIVICDNRTTAMTGMQDHPGTGFTLQGKPTKAVSYEELGRVLGIDSVNVIDPYNLRETEQVLKEALSRPGSSLVISRRPCVLYRREATGTRIPLSVDLDRCIGCRRCLETGCPSISWIDFSQLPAGSYQKLAKKQTGRAEIDRDSCTGCRICAQLCKSRAIV